MAPPSSPPLRVLIVDDQRMFADALAAQLDLDERVHVVGVALTADEAVAAARGIDVALIDLVMPLAGGIELGHALRRAQPGIRLVLVSGRSEDQLEEAARELGAAAYLRKGSLGAEVGDVVVAAAAGGTRPA